MARDRLTNPINSVAYEFDINHSNEEAFEQSKNLERTAPTDNVGLVRQQGDPSPAVLRWTGTILRQSQRDAMQSYYEHSSSTLHLRDFVGNEFEVLITAFNPVRQRCLQNPRGGTTNPNHYWTYTLEMEVIRIISGVLP